MTLIARHDFLLVPFVCEPFFRFLNFERELTEEIWWQHRASRFFRIARKRQMTMINLRRWTNLHSLTDSLSMLIKCLLQEKVRRTAKSQLMLVCLKLTRLRRFSFASFFFRGIFSWLISALSSLCCEGKGTANIATAEFAVSSIFAKMLTGVSRGANS